MTFAFDALMAKKNGDFPKFIDFTKKALRLESHAAHLFFMSKGQHPTLGILFRSAAILACDCGDFKQARRLIKKGLLGNPPEDIEEELKELEEQIEHALKIKAEAKAQFKPIVKLDINPRKDIEAYAEETFLWAEENLLPKKKVYCSALKKDVFLGAGKIRRAIDNKTYSPNTELDHETIGVINVLDKMIKESEYIAPQKDRKKRRRVEKYHELKSLVKINGRIEEVRVFIQEVQESKDVKRYIFHNYSLLK